MSWFLGRGVELTTPRRKADAVNNLEKTIWGPLLLGGLAEDKRSGIALGGFSRAFLGGSYISWHSSSSSLTGEYRPLLIWGFPKIKGTLFGGPHNKDYSIWGSILGSPYFEKLPFESWGRLILKETSLWLEFAFPPLPYRTNHDAHEISLNPLKCSAPRCKSKMLFERPHTWLAQAQNEHLRFEVPLNT